MKLGLQREHWTMNQKTWVLAQEIILQLSSWMTLIKSFNFSLSLFKKINSAKLPYIYRAFYVVHIIKNNHTNPNTFKRLQDSKKRISNFIDIYS